MIANWTKSNDISRLSRDYRTSSCPTLISHRAFGLSVGEKYHKTSFLRFDTIPECDGQTGGHLLLWLYLYPYKVTSETRLYCISLVLKTEPVQIHNKLCLALGKKGTRKQIGSNSVRTARTSMIKSDVKHSTVPLSLTVKYPSSSNFICMVLLINIFRRHKPPATANQLLRTVITKPGRFYDVEVTGIYSPSTARRRLIRRAAHENLSAVCYCAHWPFGFWTHDTVALIHSN